MPSADQLPRMQDLTGSIDRFTDWLSNFNAQAIIIGGALFPAGVAAPAATGLILIAGLETAWLAAKANLAVGVRTHEDVLDARNLRFGGPITSPALVALSAANPGIKKGIVGILRTIIRSVQAAGTLTPGELGSLGLTPHNKIRSLPLIPHNGPEITLERSGPHVLGIRYKQEGVHESIKAKPPGCKGILLKWKTGDGSSGSMLAQKCPAYVDVGASLSGQRFAMQGFWVMGNNKESGGGNVLTGGVP